LYINNIDSKNVTEDDCRNVIDNIDCKNVINNVDCENAIVALQQMFFLYMYLISLYWNYVIAMYIRRVRT